MSFIAKVQRVKSRRSLDSYRETVKETYFNLSLGDWNNEKNRADDHAITDNSDRNKVLATVVAIVCEFTNHFPNSWVYIEGNSLSRNRLYRMCITLYWNKIDPLFLVYGNLNNQWEEFKKMKNYESFLILRKYENL